MASLKFTSLAFAALLYLQNSHGSETTLTATRVNCGQEINKYREIVGLAAFTEAQILPVSSGVEAEPEKRQSADVFWGSVCDGTPLIPKSGGQPPPPTGTPAVFPNAGTKESCGDAVEYWKGTVLNFSGLPPEFVKGKEPYDNERIVSFIALFNPNANATMDCAYVTCPKAKTLRLDLWLNSPDLVPPKEPPEPEPNMRTFWDELRHALPKTFLGTPPQGPRLPAETVSKEPPEPSAEKESHEEGNLEVQHEETTGEDAPSPELDLGDAVTSAKGSSSTAGSRMLFCLSNPPALQRGKRPFSEDEWQKITQSLTGSACGATPTFLALVATALGVVLL